MAYTTQEMKVAAENLANKHTPGYQARRLTPLKFEGFQKEGLVVTQPGHINPQGTVGFHMKKKSGGFQSFSGNTVSQEEELRQANEATLTHKQMTHLVQAQVQMLEMVLKR